MPQITCLTQYLNKHFYTRSQLLAETNTDETRLERLLAQKLMPGPSYRLKISHQLDSFLGRHCQQEEVEYFNRGYACWLQSIMALEDKQPQPQDINAVVFDDFCHRYKARLANLQAQGFAITSIGEQADLNDLLQSEWQHFLNGTYGLCTRSGLPEDIAAKELAIATIKELLGKELELAPQHLEARQRTQLLRAVDLLDQVTSAFAPHERKHSSREKYINRVRVKYGFSEKMR